MLTAEQLHGWSSEKALLMGLPHIGARYTTKGGKYEAERHWCAICGITATSVHHIVPIRHGHVFGFATKYGYFELRSPLVTLCGHGTAGCHGKLHAGRMTITWAWDEPEFAEAWESGELLSRFGAHNPALYCYGRWQVFTKGELFREIRSQGL